TWLPRRMARRCPRCSCSPRPPMTTATRACLLAAALAAACAAPKERGDETPSVPTSASSKVGAAGGRVALQKASLTLPNGALGVDQTITLAESATAAPLDHKPA